MNIKASEADRLMLDLLISLKVDVESLKIMLVRKYLFHTSTPETDESIEAISEDFSETQSEVRRNLLAQIQNRYGDFDDIETMLKSIFQ